MYEERVFIEHFIGSQKSGILFRLSSLLKQKSVSTDVLYKWGMSGSGEIIFLDRGTIFVHGHLFVILKSPFIPETVTGQFFCPALR